ncbi:MAG: trypsin-like serine protease [Chromatiaceae bacterium]|nr:trypsin-like serine protease [Chromatiaceae bacterium]MCF8015799.1 trypsin-like serine protease [Chromatiaceae bacterium]
MNNRFSMAFSLGLVGSSLLGFDSASAGVIRHDRADALYTTLAAEEDYSGVGDMLIRRSNATYRCSGTLIGSSWVLTAAHCIDGGDITGGVTFGVGGQTYSGGQRIVHDNWDDNAWSGWDIALLELTSEVNDVTIAELYTGTSEFGKIGTNVGFGSTGVGNEGYISGTSGTKRAGQNVVDETNSNQQILLQDFDNPNNSSDNWFGDSNPLDLEYLIAPGDSGGGLFIEEAGNTYLAGIHSFFAWDNLTDRPGTAGYGHIAGSTRVSSFTSWISNIISPNVTAVPEPGSLSLLLIGGILFGLWPRNKKPQQRERVAG